MPLADHVTDRAEARLGSVLRGKWKLERIVGVGGMATVYAAVHRNKSKVAIKVLHPELAIDAEVTARFLREGYVANAVDHPGTVKVLDDDVTDDGAPFLVMELLEGETLDARLTRKGRLEPAEVMAISNQVLAVLEAAHERGVVHRDLKPENLFLTRMGELKILDFGIARLRELSPDGGSTRAGSLLGTPAFMAPEQARGRWDDVDACTDIWAVGATIFNLLTGRHVHEAETVQEQLIKSATVKAQSLAEALPGTSDSIVALVDRALAFDKAERFSNAKSMRLALLSAVGLSEHDAPMSLPTPSVSGMSDAQTLVAPPSSMITGPKTYTTARPVITGVDSVRQPEKSRRWAVAAGGAALLVLLGVAGIGWRLSVKPEPISPAAAAPTIKETVLVPTPPPSAADPSPEVAPAPREPAPAPVAKKPATKLPKTPAVTTPKTNPASGQTLVEPKPPSTNPFEKRL